MIRIKLALLIDSADTYRQVTSLPGKHVETLRITGFCAFSIFSRTPDDWKSPKPQ
jgi:hypothetical protein